MKSLLQLTILLGLLTLLFGCGDSQFMDKTAHTSSLLMGENVMPNSDMSARVVMIVQQYEMTDDQPQFFGICSGVVLNSRAILTAAHCLNENPRQMKIIFNPHPRLNFKPKQDVFSVSNFIIHPNYRKKAAEDVNSLTDLEANSDLAILYLDRNLVSISDELMSDYFMTSIIGEQFAQIDLVVAGYGRTTDLKNTTQIPFYNLNATLKAGIIRTNSSSLQNSYFRIAQKNSVGVCNGDSGSPLFIKTESTYALVGIAINVYQTKNQLDEDPLRTTCSGFGLYLNLKTYKKWILDTMNQLQLINDQSGLETSL